MRLPVLAVLTLFAGIYSSINAQDYPYEVPCGEVKALTVSETVTLTWDVPKFKEKPTLQPNEIFAMVDMTVAKGKSIGKYDYTLSGMPCLAMAEGGGEFNPENNEFVSGDGVRDVRLLFKVNKGESPYSLVFSYTSESLTTALGDEKTTVQLDVVEASGGDEGGEAGADTAKTTKKSNKKSTKKSTPSKGDDGDGDGDDPRKVEVW